MTTRVGSANQLSIAGVKYRVVGDITLSKTQWPQKQVDGDYNEDTQPLISVHSWHDQRGGIGVDRWKGPEDDNRAWYSECWLRNRNHLLLPPLATTTASLGSTSVKGVGTLNGLVYASVDAEFYRYTPGTDSWSASLETLNATPKAGPFLSDAYINGTNYIGVPYVTGYAVSSDGEAFTANNSIAVSELVVWDNRLWGFAHTTGQVWYTHTPGSAEVNVAKCPVATNEDSFLSHIFVGPDASGESIIYCLSTLGLFAYDAGNDVFVKTNVPQFAGQTDNGIYPAVWGGRIYLAAQMVVLEYDPTSGTVRDIGLLSKDSLPTAYIGTARCLTATHRGLLLGLKETTPGTSSSILEWDGEAWQSLYVIATATDIQGLVYVIGAASARIYFNQASTGTLTWFTYSFLSALPKQNTAYTYASSAIHKYPWYDAGQNSVIKTLLEVRVSVQDVDANDTVAVAVAYDYKEGSSDASYTTLGTINDTTTCTNGSTISTNSGSGIVSFPIASGAGLQFNAARIKLTLSGGASTTSPDVESVSLIYRKKLPDKYTITATLDLSRDYLGKNVRALHSNLITAMESATAVEVTYRTDTGGSKNYYCDVTQVAFKDSTGTREAGLVQIQATEL